MDWATKGTSDLLTLTSAYQTILESASDKLWVLDPEGIASLIFDVDFQAAPTENVDILVVKSVDNVQFETDSIAERLILPYQNREGGLEDLTAKHHVVGGCYGFKIRARTRDPDDTPGGDDTTTTLLVHYRLVV